MCEETAIWAPEAEELAAIEAELQGAPAVFGVCELLRNQGEVVGGRISAWGLAFEDHAELTSTDRSCTFSFRSVDRAMNFFSRTAEVRLIWP